MGTVAPLHRYTAEPRVRFERSHAIPQRHCEVRQKYVRYHWYSVGETFCAESECNVTFTRA